MDSRRMDPGIAAALGAAALFGAGTPLAKQLLHDTSPWLLAGLLYAGSGLALLVLRLFRRAPRGRLAQGESTYLAGAILTGGVIAPVLLMQGLTRMSASGASLLLNAEGVLTALLAWLVFGEYVGLRLALGMMVIAAGAITLTWAPQHGTAAVGPALLVVGACLAWAVDNNLTRKVSLLDATWLSCLKGLVAGATNLLIAFALGAQLPKPALVTGALLLGALAYGASLVLFVIALRRLGAARTTAYFSTAPFVGALIALFWLGEPVTTRLVIASALMALGIWLHLTESHEHLHQHQLMEHEHAHVHDEHHQHLHDIPVPSGERHTHPHRHEPLTHTHPHYPDAHHQHDHGK